MAIGVCAALPSSLARYAPQQVLLLVPPSALLQAAAALPSNISGLHLTWVDLDRLTVLASHGFMDGTVSQTFLRSSL